MIQGYGTERRLRTLEQRLRFLGGYTTMIDMPASRIGNHAMTTDLFDKKLKKVDGNAVATGPSTFWGGLVPKRNNFEDLKDADKGVWRSKSFIRTQTSPGLWFSPNARAGILVMQRIKDSADIAGFHCRGLLP